MVRCKIAIKGGLSTVSKVECAKVDVPTDQEVVDLQFVDNQLVIMILVNRGNAVPNGTP